ncbi:MAG: hydroxyacid dehydrogenase [Candidatus Ranarchaeia archaeon]
MTKVLITNNIDPIAVKMLRNKGFEVIEEIDPTEEKLKEIITDIDVLIVRSKTKVTPAVFQSADKLKIIGRAGVALDNIDLETAKINGVKVLNSPEAPTISVAELVMSGILTAARRISEADKSMKDGKWLKKQLKGTEIRGKTLGIIGLGRIGLAVADRANAFEMNVIGYDVNSYAKKIASLHKVELKEFEELLEQSDFVSLHIPLLPATKNLINKEKLDKMKEGAVIINTARGAVINESDLLGALKSGSIRYAFLDVFSEEPPKSEILNELISLSNVIATPHLGATTKEALELNSTIIAEKIIKSIKEN